MKNTTRLHALRRGQNMLLRIGKQLWPPLYARGFRSTRSWHKSRQLRFCRSTWQTMFCILKTPATFPSLRRIPDVTAHSHGAKLQPGVGIADIVAVNGQPVTGTHIRSAVNIVCNTAPTPGQAIADTVRIAAGHVHFRNPEERRHPDRDHCDERIIGGGSAPPGAPLTATGGVILRLQVVREHFSALGGRWGRRQPRREWLPNGQPP